MVLGCILINDKLITQECVFNYSFIMHISLLLKGKTTLKVMSTDKRKEFFNYTWSMEILYSPVIPVCIIRRSKEPFWVTLKISIGTAFSFSVSLAETTRKMCWKFNNKTVTLPWKYSTLLNYMYNTYYIRKQVFD